MASREVTLSRRRALQSLGVLTTAGLAGCSDSGGDGGSGDSGGSGGSGGSGSGSGGEELGERVPEPITVDYYGDIPLTAFLEQIAPIMEENLGEAFEADVDVRPISAGTLVDNAVNDKRNSHFSFFIHTADPSRLDPEELIRRRGADWAGANGRGNLENYASCEYTELAVAQSTATDEDERRDLVYRAQQILSEDAAVLPVLPYVSLGTYNSETVDPGGIGNAGINNVNPYAPLKSEPLDGDRIAINSNPPMLALKNYYKQAGSPHIVTLATLIHSTLTEFDENLELQNMLAESYEVMDDFQRIEVDLRDALFSNGDPVTAGDVKFSFEHFWGNPSTYPYSNPPDEYSIEVIDESSVVFEFGQPNPSMPSVDFATWGIVSEDAWTEAGATEDPGGFEPPMVCSGPFQVDQWTREEFISLSPHGGHPVHDPQHGIDYIGYSEEASVVEAFMAGELHLARDISFGTMQRLGEEFPEAEVASIPSAFPVYLAPQFPMNPSKFLEFRVAAGAALDRELMNEVAAYGTSDPSDALYATPFMSRHSWRAPEDMLYQLTDQVAGDVDAAQQHLLDAGWGWDDDGNLRLPASADTAPLWPQGETPAPDDFPCLTADGEVDFS